MTDYLFQGKRLDNGEVVTGSLLTFADGDRFICRDVCGVMENYPVEPESVELLEELDAKRKRTQEQEEREKLIAELATLRKYMIAFSEDCEDSDTCGACQFCFFCDRDYTPRRIYRLLERAGRAICGEEETYNEKIEN